MDSAPFPDTLSGLPGIIAGNAFVAGQGAQVLSWRDGADRERLYLSPLTGGLKDGDGDGGDLRAKAIRGGSPISFPQFSGRGALPKHGFIRNMRWTPAAHDGGASLTLNCRDNAATRRLWPHAFAARMEVHAGAQRLHMALTVTNTGDAPCEFTVALHTYLRVGDVRNARLQGLQDVSYQDATAGNVLVAQAEPDLRIAGELDRVYLSPPQRLTLHEPGVAPLLIEQQGFADSVVWNPGPLNAVALADFPDDGWLHMLCVEAACVDAPVRLAPGQSWTGSQTLSLVG
ncbi:D-hexose-6-phosphate mutarotase [Oxalobacteraceae bacterium CAVE-383]|nr:D-hexose-6-phosphate mutarotase [Oxalobacteraceae bacterium CAVE-383]